VGLPRQPIASKDGIIQCDLAEHDLRYNNAHCVWCPDGERTTPTVKNAAGKHLTHPQPRFKIISSLAQA
jgi:hypothetical protein